MSLVVSGLFSYPVKSLRGHSQASTHITSWGPDRDRRWMVVDDSGQFMTQRQLPKMCRIGARYQGGDICLWHLDSPADAIEVCLDGSEKERYVGVWEDSCTALDAGDAAANWLSAQLGVSLRLCYMPDYSYRQVDLQFAERGDRLGFADGFPFLLCNEASLQQLCAGLGRSVDMQRFRPNIVISGAVPFAEDHWRRIRIGDIEFDVVKACARCAIPTVNLDDASREADVFRALKAQRQRGDEVYFGQNMIHRGEGEIRLGDAVEVLALN
ncbi:MOSC domain-containing protein [Zhongshania sp.]|uniref:MOSC domain-containing protein n=1 Tax=Zhongshania sp. TaxID=1971902 RepID=UPI002A81FF1D|nr:MOSC N-terminal beta barrel domain-containing protein [Zhongshania sp.]